MISFSTFSFIGFPMSTLVSSPVDFIERDFSDTFDVSDLSYSDLLIVFSRIISFYRLTNYLLYSFLLKFIPLFLRFRLKLPEPPLVKLLEESSLVVSLPLSEPRENNDLSLSSFSLLTCGDLSQG